MARHKPHKTSSLAFPNNWTSEWLLKAVSSTPKWQLESILNSYKYAQWIGYLSSELNGLRLPAKTGVIEQDVMRSVIVGLKVHEASMQYENTMHDTTLAKKIEYLENMMKYPIVRDQVKALIQMPMTPMRPTVQSLEVQVPEEVPGEETEIKVTPGKAPAVIVSE